MIGDKAQDAQVKQVKCGVYEIVNTSNGKRYVGSSKNIDSRFREHRRELRKGSHHAVKLQRSWNKYGEDSFGFSIVELCAPGERLSIEQAQMDLGAQLNSHPKAKNAEGFQHSDESKERRKAMMRERFKNDKALSEMLTRGNPGPKSEEFKRMVSEKHKGVKKSETQVMNMAKARAVIDEAQALEVIGLRKSGLTIREITEITGLTYGTVQRVCSGGGYKWVDGGLSKEEAKSLRYVRKPEDSPTYSPKIHQFYHPAHGERICTQLSLRTEFKDLPSRGVSALCTGKRASHHGWRIKPVV